MDREYMGMIHEDHSEVANLPQQVMMKKYPRNKYESSYEIDDTIRGIDETCRYDEHLIERHQSDSKY